MGSKSMEFVITVTLDKVNTLRLFSPAGSHVVHLATDDGCVSAPPGADQVPRVCHHGALERDACVEGHRVENMGSGFATGWV